MTRAPVILHVLSQRPSLTGSGITLDALVRHAAPGWNQVVVVGVPLEQTHIRRFSNDNLYLQLGASVRSRAVFVIQSLSPPLRCADSYTFTPSLYPSHHISCP